MKLDSSHLKSVEYNKEKKELVIGFAGGEKYKYSNVPERIYNGLVDAPSHGQYHAERIRNKYKFKEV